MKSLIEYWKSHPKFRVGARTVAVAAATYAVQSWRAGEVTDLRPLVDGTITAAITATLGLIGLEPFIGLKSKVEVPADSAELTH